MAALVGWRARPSESNRPKTRVRARPRRSPEGGHGGAAPISDILRRGNGATNLRCLDAGNRPVNANFSSIPGGRSRRRFGICGRRVASTSGFLKFRPCPCRSYNDEGTLRPAVFVNSAERSKERARVAVAGNHADEPQRFFRPIEPNSSIGGWVATCDDSRSCHKFSLRDPAPERTHSLAKAPGAPSAESRSLGGIGGRRGFGRLGLVRGFRCVRRVEIWEPRRFGR